MTNEEINEAIAKHTGWKQCDCGNKDCLAWFRKESWEPEFAPLFATNLNAMHDAEEMLTDDQWVEYRENIRTVVLGPVRYVSQWCKADIHSTARQRAEAFLRTVGNWKEVKL